jgi:glycosyltransferase involved in cell wall biosynthesis
LESQSIWKHILTVGPYNYDKKGGMGSVINSYSKFSDDFMLISTYQKGRSKYYNIIIYLCAIFKLFNVLISNKKIKILHIHSASKGSFYRKYFVFLIGKHIFNKRIIYHIHSGGFLAFYKDSNKFIRNRIETLLKKSDKVICVSEIWKAKIEKTFTLNNIIVLRNPVEKPIITEKKEGNKKVIFLFLGNIIKNKGVFDLLDVAKSVVDEGASNFELLIGGDGENKRFIKQICEKELQEYIKFLGWVKGDVKQKLMIQSDIFILPSYYEGLPISILEAMSYHMPIISTAIGGIPELVKEKRNGLLCQPGEKKELKKSMLFFIENRELIKTYGEQSAIIVEKYYRENVMKDLHNLYCKILAD